MYRKGLAERVHNARKKSFHELVMSAEGIEAMSAVIEISKIWGIKLTDDEKEHLKSNEFIKKEYFKED